MSRVSKKNLKLAHSIMHAVSEKEVVDETKLKTFLKVLENNPGSQSRQVLQVIVKMLERQAKENSLVVETPFPLEESTQKELLAKFEHSLGKKLTLTVVENKTLIGGLKISNEDFVWENTVGSNLEQLKGEFLQNG